MSFSVAFSVRSAAAALWLLGAAAAQSFFSTNTLNTALDAARADGTIVVVAILMPGERGSDAMLEQHYRDAKIVQLARESVNIKLVVGPEGSPPADERLVRERYLKVEPEALLPAPHHLFIDPGEAGSDGTLISSFAYEVTAGQLEWAWADAIKKVKQDFAWELSERARAPEMLLYGAAGGEGTRLAPTKQEVDAAIKELKAGGFDFRARMENYRTVLASDEPVALKFGQQEMRNLPGGFRKTGLTTVALLSPKAWYSFAEEFLTDREPDLREEAARTLEMLAEPKGLKATRKQYGKEKEANVRGRLLRAMAICGPDDKSVVKELEKVLTKDKVAEVRVQAAAAAAVLEDRDAAHRLLTSALADGDAHVRTAATYGIASRRDADMKEVLERIKKDERNIEVSQWMATAIEVIDGGDLRQFDAFKKEILGDRTRADIARQMREGGRGGRNREPGEAGEGEGEPGAGGPGKDGAGAGAGGDGAGAGGRDGRGRRGGG